jgi:hypothetical protein
VYRVTRNNNGEQSTREGRLAISRDSVIINEAVVGVEPESTAGECLEEVAFVGAVVKIGVCLDPCITSFDNWKQSNSSA